MSGATEILTVLRDSNSPSWRFDSDTKKVEAVAHPLAGGTFVLDVKTGLPIRATREQLAKSLQPTPPDTHCILVATGAKGARCLADINGTRIAKIDWGNKTGTVQSVQIVEKMGSHALIAFTDHHDAMAYSLPNLEYMCTLQLPITDESLSCDDTGDWMACTVNRATGIIDHASYGTVFDFRRAYTPPNITIPKPTVPSQPQPVSLGPTSLISSLFRFGKSMTGEQLDILLGGPDRPIPVPAKEAKPRVTATQANAPSVAQQAAGAQSSLYSRLQSAMGERSQMLGDLEDRFNSLEEGSKSMVAQLEETNEQLSALSSNPETLSASMLRTIQNHAEVFQDNVRELKRTKASVKSALDHANLLSGVRNDIDAYKSSAADSLLNERGHIDSSHSMVDGMLDQAYETRAEFGRQRTALDGINSRMKTVLNTMPGISNLVNMIKSRRRRDTIIMGVVIGVCIIIILSYMWR
ncbi:WD40 containing SNARE-dependent exocytosis protein [Mycena venus]|uniref:WD40 containing SNARE-dependent exocytosis protein n=1 Tax=Mycena venus TaxID=2733690 RepID=A0A8H7CTL8_9AGAR|nr:WD40 containing SNARE-dependent exocytosis protein [Mycena venus]